MSLEFTRRIMVLLLVVAAAQAAASVTVDDLLARESQPPGVVFEVIASEDALTWAIPQINDHVRALRERWPGLEIAVVSHGREQFALMTREANTYAEAHAGVQQLVENDGVQVHVCETHASWEDVSPEDFPDYVDVTPAGPVQIRMYQELGYELVVISGY
jgi:intracellular sulfur oxidation DsrE/DsrF family protein